MKFVTSLGLSWSVLKKEKKSETHNALNAISKFH